MVYLKGTYFANSQLHIWTRVTWYTSQLKKNNNKQTKEKNNPNLDYCHVKPLCH